jgi:hypothetical protein
MDMAGIPVSMLGKPIDNLEQKRTQMVNALDFLVNGL